MDKFAKITERQYQLFDYSGHASPERVLILMGSGGETAEATVKHLAAEGREGRRGPRPTVSAILESNTFWLRCRRPSSPLQCLTARRSRAQAANRCTWMWSMRCEKGAAPK